MKYSFNLGQQYSEADISKLKLLSKTELAEKLNSQIGAFDKITFLGEQYSGVFVVKVVKISKHHDADKLNVCLIDDGGKAKDVERDENGLVQVVCGAPNVREGMLVAWIAPGSVVPSTAEDKEPFTLAKIKLRGVESNGMLASAKELGISGDHEGLLELKAEDVEDERLLKVGSEFKKLFGLDDIIVDFENKMFTHRPDCFGHLGIARELAGIQSVSFKSPDWYSPEVKSPQKASSLKLSVDNEIKDLCPRYSAVVIEGVEVKASPIWLQSTLMRLGIRPINNLVDVTNYMMVLTGQPLHAFDFDKVAGEGSSEAKILVRGAKESEELELLSGKKIKLSNKDILITDGTKPIALGGVMGGGNSEVDEKTTRIILESANFDMYAIRRTSMRHGLFTDAVTRFTKGQSEAQTYPVLLKAMSMLKELLPGVKFGEVVDLENKKFEHEHLNVPVEKINRLLGLDLKDKEIEKVLANVEIQSHDLGKMNELCVTPPFWRTDLEIEEDVIEEIGRLYGFNRIESKLPVRTSSPARANEMIELKSQIRAKLASLGANEVLTYNFISEKLLDSAGQDPEMAYRIRNALSPGLQRYRLSLIPNLLEKVHQNIKAGTDEFVLFELGKCHVKDHLEEDGKLPVEFQRLSLVFASKLRGENGSGATFYTAKNYLEKLMSNLNVKFKLVELSNEMFGKKIPVTSVYAKERSAGIEIEGDLYGVIGEFNKEVAKNFKLPERSAGFELDLSLIVHRFSKDINYTPLLKFPEIIQDVTLERDDSSKFAEVLYDVEENLEKLAKTEGIKFSIEAKSIYQKELGDKKKFTFEITFWNDDRTLKTEEVNKLTAKLN